MTGWNLPPGCTQDDIDRAFGGYEDECEHEAYQIDWQGRAHCDRCEESWWASAAEVESFHECMRLAEAFGRRQARRERWKKLTFVIRWPLYRLLQKLWPRKSCTVLHDDEIPF